MSLATPQSPAFHASGVDAPRRSARALPWFWGAACAAVTLGAYLYADSRESALRHAESAREATEIVAAWVERQQAVLADLSTFGGFFESSQSVEAQEFERFAAHLDRGAPGSRTYALFVPEESGAWELRHVWPASVSRADVGAALAAAADTEFLGTAHARDGLVAGMPSTADGGAGSGAGPSKTLLCAAVSTSGASAPIGVLASWLTSSEAGAHASPDTFVYTLFDRDCDGNEFELTATAVEPRARGTIERTKRGALAWNEFDLGGRERSLVAAENPALSRPVAPAPLIVLSIGALASLVVVQWQRATVRRELEIQHQVRLRTRELRSANEELDSFSYSVSHDLRAPLRALSGFSKVLVEEHSTELGPDARHCVEAIARNSERMGQLIDDLLRLSRASRQDLHLEPLDTGPLVDGVWDQLANEREGRRIEFRRGDLPTVHADRALLEVALRNLLSNAIKFTRPRDVAHVSVESRSDDARAVIVVRDDGVGFDMRFAAQLFGVFQRLHRAEEFEGTGLGLALARRILARHGGTLDAQGEPGHEASFTLTLPVSRAP
ncbi:MAG: hypothetical protein IT454_13230 [Planctomycetes bacterium]|nr:hypothetical protein [Planctomycetota bacterium]